ncbi:hypothetical protein O3P69_014212 [Scylla paramamosain]|uniref:Uncharacterized protein n=1 Tax=Scylla paramamosain TaxID=85552 RepID=A0AAW0SEB5_SCYPA
MGAEWDLILVDYPRPSLADLLGGSQDPGLAFKRHSSTLGARAFIPIVSYYVSSYLTRTSYLQSAHPAVGGRHHPSQQFVVIHLTCAFLKKTEQLSCL